jgi:ABC-2 type transport system ATP-binding protein
MPGGAGDQARRASTGARRLATRTEVAAYLQVPMRTSYAWRYHVSADPDAPHNKIGVALQEAGLDPRQTGR